MGKPPPPTIPFHSIQLRLLFLYYRLRFFSFSFSSPPPSPQLIMIFFISLSLSLSHSFLSIESNFYGSLDVRRLLLLSILFSFLFLITFTFHFSISGTRVPTGKLCYQKKNEPSQTDARLNKDEQNLFKKNQ